MQWDTERMCDEGAMQGGTGQVVAQQLQLGLHRGSCQLLRMHPHRGLGAPHPHPHQRSDRPLSGAGRQ